MHHLWGAEKCTNRCTTVAERQWLQPRKTKRQKQPQNRSRKRKDKSPKPSSGDCVNRLARVPLSKSRTTGRQSDGSTGCNENAQLAPSESIAPRECGWKHGDSGHSAGENFVEQKHTRIHLTPTGLLMEGRLHSNFSFFRFGSHLGICQ